MSNEHATQICGCPDCSGNIEVLVCWNAQGLNDYGGFILECDTCKGRLHMRIGRDVNDSRVVTGAKLLAKYKDGLDDKAEILREFGVHE